MIEIMDDKVDPNLFVTCRLCLGDLGQYQIVPKVQQQIKYCFNIKVDPFDGLPQLICVKCKGILNNFFEIKTLFTEKQADLRNRVTRKELSAEKYIFQHQQNTVSSSQQASDDTNTQKKKYSKKRVRNSSLSDGSESGSSYTHLKRKKRKSSKKVTSRSLVSWELPYKKSISCHLCYTVWPNKNSYAKHMRSHSHLVEKYKNILKRQCKINLVKIDGKPNLTGLPDMVVHNKNKIVAPGDSYFCTIYSKEDPICSSSDIQQVVQENNENSSSSSDDEHIVFRPTRRNKRFISRSSNETVVIASNSNKILSDLEEDSSTQFNNDDTPLIDNSQCINIEDSSDSELPCEENTQKVKQPIVAKDSDYQTIQDMISACVSSYTSKKRETSEIDSNTNKQKEKMKDKVSTVSLNHKVLSIGRKIVNKQGFNCTGLLRYLEYKDLDIVWLPKPVSTKNTNYIRISITKSDAHANDRESMWVDTDRSLMSSKPGTDPNPPMAVTLYLDNKSNDSDSKIILNANPVAHPKQLPRKLAPATESRQLPSRTFEEPAFCMPIIASTTSLAEVSTDQQNQEANDKTSATSGATVEMTTSAPRIKVKPVSELMSQETLDSLRQEQIISATNNGIMLTNHMDKVWQHKPDEVFSNVLVQPQVDRPTVPINQMPVLNLDNTEHSNSGSSNDKDDSQDYVILDTADLPNTKTKSPMSYLKSLLQIHNIVLLGTDEAITKDFICLIKFKALFKQNKTTPILLCLSLHCFKNTFSLQIRDSSQLGIDMFQMSANWQWEILQVYCGEVSVKTIESARKHGQEVYDYTNHFYCLLKSINYRKA
ncbi:hypothetical protein HF086_001219 [Spodoptera exigua]|uniref:ZAD domain-containing protein n=1 Tax=Spodoptera exigua TaxID=7107 RepID=A0A922MBS6_SPOEX|nr:hypothetical protein HF086_001219 [Spodoptera exigua]